MSRLYLAQSALLDLKFADARRHIELLKSDHPGHRLAKFASVAWARATGHPVLLHDAIDDLLADYPRDPTLVLTKAATQRELGRVPERLATLQTEGVRADADPLLIQSLAQMLLPDPATQFEADRLLRRSVRIRPQAAAGYYLLATQRWEHQKFAEAVELYRFATLPR